MDLYKAIRYLYEERDRLDRVIASLEESQHSAGIEEPTTPVKRRGRKTMSAEERREVSERMKQYWASRKKRKGRPSGEDR